MIYRYTVRVDGRLCFGSYFLPVTRLYGWGKTDVARQGDCCRLSKCRVQGIVETRECMCACVVCSHFVDYLTKRVIAAPNT